MQPRDFFFPPKVSTKMFLSIRRLNEALILFTACLRGPGRQAVADEISKGPQKY